MKLMFQIIRHRAFTSCSRDTCAITYYFYYSDRDPVALEECLCKEVEKANQWYNDNGMIVNETKHQALIRGDTEYTFSFPVKESIDIFGMNIDNKLQFDKHVSSICKKINNQLNVMTHWDLENWSLKPLWSNCIKPLYYHTFIIVHRCGISAAHEIPRN